jgi:hypothetical protein
MKAAENILGNEDDIQKLNDILTFVAIIIIFKIK